MFWMKNKADKHVRGLKDMAPNPECFRFGREIHPLDPQPHRHSMLVPEYVRLGLRGVAWGSIGHVIQQEAGRMLAGRQPILWYTGYL